MIEAEFTYFDLAVMGIMGLSCLFAFFRGFVKEILSLGAWIGAGIVTLYFFQDVAEMIKPHVKSDLVSGGLSALGLYIIALIAFSLVNTLIMKMFKEGGDVGILDNTLGLLFGAFRGAFVISLGTFLLMTVMTKDNAPDWFKNARTKDHAIKGAIILGKAAPEYLVELSTLKDEIVENKSVMKQATDLFPESSDADTVDLQRKVDEDQFDRIMNQEQRRY